MPRTESVPHVDLEDKEVCRLADLLGRLVAKRAGPNATFEERQRARAEVIAGAAWLDEHHDLERLVTSAKEIDVNDVSYVRLEQPSSATYHGLWGAHEIGEPLYRKAGVHNGPTIKPIELRVGVVAEHMLPDLAREAGFLSAHMTSRDIETTLKRLGFRPPGRAFLEKRPKTMAGEIAVRVIELEEAARAAVPAADAQRPVKAVSCGLDRMAVRMDEPRPETETPPDPVKRRRKKPYQRTPPPAAAFVWRMAWVGSVTEYDADGDPIRTLRYGTDAGAGRDELIERLVADVRAAVDRNPSASVLCLQDGARDLSDLPKELRAEMSSGATEDLAALNSKLGCVFAPGTATKPVINLTDFHHLTTYLDEVVRTCEPKGDPNNMSRWYRDRLLESDDAIDNILRGLRRRARSLPRSNKAGRKAVAKAVGYIRRRRETMRYASVHAQGLPIGSGATESTCALMQLRVKRPGMAWEPSGLRGIMTIRGLVLSERWDPAWHAYADSKRAEVTETRSDPSPRRRKGGPAARRSRWRHSAMVGRTSERLPAERRPAS